MMTPISSIQAINASDIPDELVDVCLEINPEFPLHYSTGLVSLWDDGNAFSEWLKSQGFKFPKGEDWTWLGVWGT